MTLMKSSKNCFETFFVEMEKRNTKQELLLGTDVHFSFTKKRNAIRGSRPSIYLKRCLLHSVWKPFIHSSIHIQQSLIILNGQQHPGNVPIKLSSIFEYFMKLLVVLFFSFSFRAHCKIWVLHEQPLKFSCDKSANHIVNQACQRHHPSVTLSLLRWLSVFAVRWRLDSWYSEHVSHNKRCMYVWAGTLSVTAHHTLGSRNRHLRSLCQTRTVLPSRQSHGNALSRWIMNGSQVHFTRAFQAQTHTHCILIIWVWAAVRHRWLIPTDDFTTSTLLIVSMKSIHPAQDVSNAVEINMNATNCTQ